MARYFCMMLRNKNKNAKRRVPIRNFKPKFVRVQSGEFNFFIDEIRNHVSNEFIVFDKSSIVCHDSTALILFFNNNYLTFIQSFAQNMKNFPFLWEIFN